MLGLGLGLNKAWCLGGALNSFSIAKSFYFDGVNQDFSADSLVSNVSSNTKGTFNILYKPLETTKAANETIVSFGNSSTLEYLGIFHLSTGKLSIQTVKVSTTQFNIHATNIPFTIGEWCLITIVQNGVRPIIYINGLPIAMTDVNNTNLTSWLSNLTNVDTFNIGAIDYNGGGEQFYLNGYVSQVSYIDTDISAAQCLDFYNEGQPKNPQTLFGANCKFFFNPDNSGDTAQFSVVDNVNSITATSSNMTDADKTPITPYADPIADLVTNYSFINAWGFENQSINGTTSTLIDYKAIHDLSNPAIANQWTFIGGDANINNRPSGYFVTDDYAYKAVANYNSGASTGGIHAVFTTNADVTNTGTIFCTSDESSVSYYVGMLITSGKIKIIIRNTTATATRYEVTCDTTAISSNTSYAVSVYQNGSTLQVLINGVTQSLTVTAGTAETYWFADIPNRDNISIGALVGSVVIYADLDIAFVGVSEDFADATVLSTHNELKTIFGI